MKKPVVHFEIGCSDLSETVEFYKKVFDWSVNNEGNSASINHEAENGIPGHFTELGHEPHKYINIYIETETLEEDLKKIESNRGKKLVGPIDLPDGRTFAWFKDVAGNTVGLISKER